MSSPYPWTPEQDATALALYFGEIDWMEAHRRTGMGQKRLRRHAYELLKAGRPTASERRKAIELPFSTQPQG